MTLPTPLELAGAPGSPYTRKMLAYLRYRQIPYRFLTGNPRDKTDRPQPKVSLMPTFYLPNDSGEMEAVVDSTPLIRRFEAAFSDRHVVPDNAALAFLDYLLEDFADEWLTKYMFHYRWYYQADIDKAGSILPRWHAISAPEDQIKEASKFISERQISRLYVVGSNDITAPVIEASYKRYLGALRDHLETSRFLLGNRPGAGDFGAYGQLTQLAGFDPTPMAIALETAPRVYAWVDIMEDLSGLEVSDDDWQSPTEISDTLKAILAEIGRVYTPFLLANAEALMDGADAVEVEIDGKPWTQQPFPYQGKCLQWIREEFGKLSAGDQSGVLSVLDGTGCEPLLKS